MAEDGDIPLVELGESSPGGDVVGMGRRRGRGGEFLPMTDDEADFFAAIEDEPDRRLYDDVLWVSRYLDVPRISLKEFPSRRAWSLLHWARENRNEFFKSMLPKAEGDAIQASKGQREEEAWRPDEPHRQMVGELRGMLVDLVADSERAAVDAAEGVVELPVAAKKKRGRRK